MLTKFSKFSNHSQAVTYAILACFFSSVMISLVRHLCAEFHVFFIVMVRNFFGLVFFLPYIFRNFKTLQTNKFKLHFFRGFNSLMSMLSWFYVISLMPLSEAVSFSFIIPILTMIAAVIFLKEKTQANSWLASLIGLVGILIILRPGFKEFNFAYIFAFISVILWTISNLVIKVMTKTEKPNTIVVYMSLVMLVISIPIAFPYMKPINLENFFYFAFLGLTSNLTHICISNSYAKADLSVIQPFDFTRLIFTAVIAYFAFGEVIDAWVVVGSLVILLGVIVAKPKSKNFK